MSVTCWTPTLFVLNAFSVAMLLAGSSKKTVTHLASALEFIMDDFLGTSIQFAEKQIKLLETEHAQQMVRFINHKFA